MAFASWGFVLVFLPIVVAAFHAVLAGHARHLRPLLLIGASLAFYALSGWVNSAIFLCSLGLNFAVGTMLLRTGRQPRSRKRLLWLGVGANLAILIAFKVAALDLGDGRGFRTETAILIPLALSYLTFQQIGFVVACFRAQIVSLTIREYLFFIAFFPHLVMGPIMRFHDLADQLNDRSAERANVQDLAVGLSIFTFGLAQKLLLADQLAVPVDRVFSAAAVAPVASGDMVFAVAGFQLQLFFDFSGYSEMAIGLARMFGICLPVNFDRPLFARDRLDLWRRWHITFVAFMRVHVFMPLLRRARLPVWAALAITGMLSGLWHGLGITFVIWGLVQTALMLIVHWRRGRTRKRGGSTAIPVPLAIALTFATSCLIGALFRAPTLQAAGNIYGALVIPDATPVALIGPYSLLMLAIAAAVAWIMPSTRQIFRDHWDASDLRNDPPPLPRHVFEGALAFRLNPAWGVAIAILFMLCLTQLDAARRFIYVQF